MDSPFEKSYVKITVIGGGTGSFTLLQALKKYTKQLAAVVNMSDDGGSTGALRDELGVLPPGDVRQCLVALSKSPLMRELFSYRFEEGTFKGHAFGNIFLTALEKTTGSFDEAVAAASDILSISGKVIPATLDNIRLKMKWPGASIILNGQRTISSDYFKLDPRRAILSLIPNAKPNLMAIAAIEQADIVIISPGDLYSSLGPLLVIDGIGEALAKTKAIKVYVSNLVTKYGQTGGFTVADHANEVERFAKAKFLDYVLYNKQKPSRLVLKRYEKEKAFLVKIDKKNLEKYHYRAIAGDLLGEMALPNKSDKLIKKRSLIRHNGEAVAKAIVELYDSKL